ncbi:MAG: hypothetical protein Unbinned8454contig1000_14 [Prokaryotic dsDNA virus sp.]|nr:MAG: hypothetical protein Unbinned8454contig1000_14 [Prokaryotic dsDNA virus sp.]|tara:strand:+ start:13100 stop:13561 length:462 start_codon:yes stop_codon:yes gene_type:complete
MIAVYETLDKIKNLLRENPSTQTVTFGDLMEVDLAKTTIFPLAHVQIGNVTFRDHIIVMEVAVLFLDIVDDNRETNSFDQFYDNDNLIDILNTQLSAANILQGKLRRGAAYNELFQVQGDISAQPFLDRFENQLAGWGVDLVIELPNKTTSVC